MKTYIIGHKKPDTDAVVAAMALEFLYKSWEQFGYTEPIAVITDELNPETSFLFQKFNVQPPGVINSKNISPDDKFILVDHNEASQRLDGMNEDQIIEVVDHHKVNLNLKSPIYLTFKPWGSSCSIVYYMMKKYNVRPTKELAALMLAAILSDTVGYKSATTTDHEKKFGAELAEIAEVLDVEAFTLEIFRAKSDVSNLTDEEIVKNDYKVFEFNQKTMIDQLETVEQDMVILEKKAGLLEAMAKVKQELGVELLFVAITDILKVNTKLLILSDAEKAVAEKAFDSTVADNVMDIGSKMSRKKEIAPAIETALK